MIFLSEHMEQGASLFDRMSVNELQEVPIRNATKIFGYSLTISHFDCDTNKFIFLNSLPPLDTVFGDNQANILNIAKTMFAESISLTAFEQDVLDKTFYRLAKKKSTIKGRA